MDHLKHPKKIFIFNSKDWDKYQHNMKSKCLGTTISTRYNFCKHIVNVKNLAVLKSPCQKFYIHLSTNSIKYVKEKQKANYSQFSNGLF